MAGVEPGRGGVVEKLRFSTGRAPLAPPGRRIALTLSSRRRSNATAKGVFVSKGQSRLNNEGLRPSLDTARKRAYSG